MERFCLGVKHFSGLTVTCLEGVWCDGNFHPESYVSLGSAFLLYMYVSLPVKFSLFLLTVGTCDLFDLISVCVDALFCSVLFVKHGILGERSGGGGGALVIHSQLKSVFFLSLCIYGVLWLSTNRVCFQLKPVNFCPRSDCRFDMAFSRRRGVCVCVCVGGVMAEYMPLCVHTVVIFCPCARLVNVAYWSCIIARNFKLYRQASVWIVNLSIAL